MRFNMFVSNHSTDLKYGDNDLSSLKTVKIYDGNGNLKKTVIAEILTDDEALGRKGTYGEKECRVCHNMFTLYKGKFKRKQKTCHPPSSLAFH